MLNAFTCNAQCGTALVDSAMLDCGSSAIYMQEFKVRFNEGTIDNPTPTRKYSVMLSENVVYRFAVRSAEEYEGEVILQLFERDKLLGSTYDIRKRKDIKQFDFRCDRSGRYQVLMSFKEGKAGCAAGVMTMVLEDTASTFDPTVLMVNDDNILYMHMRNKLQVASADVADGNFELSISHGLLQQTAKGFIIEVFEEKKADVYVMLKSKSDSVLQIDTISFDVKPLPTPWPILHDKMGGIISMQDIWKLQKLDLLYVYDYSTNRPPFEILSFMISRTNSGFDGILSDGRFINMQQKQMLTELETGQNFFVTNIRVKGPDGKIQSLPPIGFIVE